MCVLFSLYNNNLVYLTMMFIKLGFPFLASLQHVVLRLHVYCPINGIKNNLLFVILCKFDRIFVMFCLYSTITFSAGKG